MAVHALLKLRTTYLAALPAKAGIQGNRTSLAAATRQTALRSAPEGSIAERSNGLLSLSRGRR
jgi:hypothetical protein